MASAAAAVMKIRLRLKDIEKIESSKNGLFCKKSYKNCLCISEFLKQRVEEYHWMCSNYTFRHAKLLHPAERKLSFSLRNFLS